MGRTLPSITQTFLQEQDAFARFQRAIVSKAQTLLMQNPTIFSN
jgi:hypothetical protein